jgi:hypothetical protein
MGVVQWAGVIRGEKKIDYWRVSKNDFFDSTFVTAGASITGMNTIDFWLASVSDYMRFFRYVHARF